MADENTTMDASAGIFHDHKFAIIPSSISSDDIRELQNQILEHGAQSVRVTAEHGHIDQLHELTHIISETSDFPDYTAALDLYIHTVRPSYVAASIQKGKAANPRAYNPDPALYMSEVTVTCGNIPEGDKEAIIGGVLALGGQYSLKLSKMTTHLIALDEEDERFKLVVDKRMRCRSVLPHWFDDCLKLGHRISERPYTLPNPEILDNDINGAPQNREHPHIEGATNPNPKTMLTPPSEPNKPIALSVFSGRNIMLSDDLELTEHLKKSIEEIVKNSGGQLTDSVDIAHMYVGKYRKGAAYIEASQAKKDVGSLAWLFYMITHHRWTDPMLRLLHYPIPPEGVPGFKNMKISLSGYTGPARTYLENLALATGATFTKTFTQQNTHLIAAHQVSDKCEAALEWDINVVNHLWLEESYAKCKEMPLSNTRYTHFPSRTNLGEVLGQTQIDREAVEKNYFKAQKGRKSKVIEEVKQNDVPGSSAPTSRVSSDPVAHGTPLAQKNKRSKSGQDVSTPSVVRQIDGKENETPGTTGSRGAKDRALSKIHDAAPDIAKFDKEMKRRGGVIHGGKRSKDEDPPEKKLDQKSRESAGSKRSFEEVENDEDAISADEMHQDASKKTKKAKKTPIIYRMVVSKYERWSNDANRESLDKNKMREIGLYIADDHNKIDLVCAPKLVRTKKIVAALAQAPMFVHTSFLDYAIKNNKLPPPEKHLLVDRANEKAFGFRLEDAIDRAEQNKKRLLKDFDIFVGSHVPGGLDTYRDIIKANGGRCHEWKGRTSMNVSKRSIDTAAGDEEVSQNLEEDDGNTLYFVSDANKNEMALWPKFRELAKNCDMVPRIVKTEWLLFVAMAQYLHWKPEWELKEASGKAK